MRSLRRLMTLHRKRTRRQMVNYPSGRPVPVARALAWAYLKYTESGLEMSKECRAVGLSELLPRVRQRRRRLARDEADC